MTSLRKAETPKLKELKVIIPDITKSPTMKPAVKVSLKKSNINGVHDEDNVRYKINEDYFKEKSVLNKPSESDDVLYMLPQSKASYNVVPKKIKTKSKIKVKFWSNKLNRPIDKNNIKATPPNSPRKSRNVTKKPKSPKVQSPKNSSPKLRQKVSFLPPPEFTDQHAPMVTVPDDLTVHFSPEEANYLLMTTDAKPTRNATTSTPKKSPNRRQSPSPQTSPKNGQKRKRDDENQNADLEYFAKYVVQKLRRMETNQRIYSENLINTVLMLGQLQQLNGKSHITET